jgi:hypothetical protein
MTNDVNALATNLFGSSVATSVTQKDVNNYLALAIIGTVIAVSFEPNMFQIGDYYLGFLLLIERLNFFFFTILYTSTNNGKPHRKMWRSYFVQIFTYLYILT